MEERESSEASSSYDAVRITPALLAAAGAGSGPAQWRMTVNLDLRAASPVRRIRTLECFGSFTNLKTLDLSGMSPLFIDYEPSPLVLNLKYLGVPLMPTSTF
jgi:hypothetical protein